jgi:trehalose synthase-fused probable maltokinase
MVAKIFISYRRDDSRYQARMIYDALCNVVPRDRVFMDIDTIPLGANFRTILKDWVDQCEVLLALIGPGWMDARDPSTKRRRLENRSDFVRIEIGEALARRIPVVPVFIDGAPLLDVELLPDDLRELAERQSEFVEFRTFNADVQRLIRRLNLGQAVDEAPAKIHPSASAKSRGQGAPRRTGEAKGARRRPAPTGGKVGTLEAEAKSRATQSQPIGTASENAKTKAFVPPEVVTLVMGEGWHSLLEGRARSNLEQNVLPAFLSRRRWYADKGARFISATLQTGITLEGGDPGTMLALIDFRGERGASRYAVPLAVKWCRFDKISSSDNIVAAVRRYAREGTLVDVATDPEFISLLLGNIHAGRAIDAGDRRIEFRPTEAFASMPPPAVENVRNREGGNASTTIIDDQIVVKMFRRLQSGDHPEAEIGRFLTDTVHYRNAPLFLGAMELHEGDTSTTLAVAHALVQNEGDAWTVTANYLDRFIDELRALAPDAPSGNQEIASHLQRMRHIGHCTAELQNALASRPDIPGFAPESVTPQEAAAWTRRLVDRAESTFGELARRQSELDESARVLANRVLGAAAQTLSLINTLLTPALRVLKVRYHGDLHLGQILLAKDDAYIAGFQGEPQGSPEEPRKAPAARDVAGLIRSIDYAAMAAFDRALQKWPKGHSRLSNALDNWSRQSIGIFMASYRQTLTKNNLWPADRAEADRLLDFFLLEKALYEVNYELANRPRLLGVPLLALDRILTKRLSPFSSAQD